MPNRLQVLLMILLLAACSLPALASPDEGWQAPPPIESEVLKEECRYRVLLPESYSGNPTKHYPMLLLLDGSCYGPLHRSVNAFTEPRVSTSPVAPPPTMNTFPPKTT
jgi:hypothetical protein